jgi:hypothetical protein
MLSVVMLSVVMLSVVMLKVLALSYIVCRAKAICFCFNVLKNNYLDRAQCYKSRKFQSFVLGWNGCPWQACPVKSNICG